MPIHLYRSNRTEHLVEVLCELLSRVMPADPFEAYPVVVGSRGMERWLRHEVATQLDIATGLAFPFPRQVMAGATRWLLDPERDARARFWEIDGAARVEAAAWERDALAFRLVGLLRERGEEPGFEAVSRYLDEGRQDAEGAPVTARELLFASEVGDVLDRLMHDRPRDVLEWAAAPETADEGHRWLARLLADIGAGERPLSPAVLHRELMALEPFDSGRSLCVFGLSTMGPGDRERLTAIARSVDVHLFVLVPTDQWFKDQRTPGEARAALREATDPEEIARIEAELESDNPVLRSLGVPSRDLQAWLADIDVQGDLVEASDPVDPESPTLLQRLQGWVLGAEAIPERSAWPVDASLTAHSTWGAMRQCEVLRDELLGMFAADPTLEPRDVVVMTPDIETYAPLVAAVFSRRGKASGAGQLPRIPVTIADLGLRRTNPVAEVLLQALDVAGDRLHASWVLDFLALEPVRIQWGLDDEDLGDLRQLVQESGLRWGVDAADRAAVGQPALDQNTARFAVERMALGVLMPDEDPLGVVRGTGDELGPAVPLDVESRARVHRVGRLAAILRALAAHRRAMATPTTIAGWRDRLVSVLDELTATTEEGAWLRAEVDAALDDLVATGELLGDRPVTREGVSRWLQDRFEIPQRGDRAITGAVQVCALEPMRSVPFRVVALLGMDDGAFPRGQRPRTWDPMVQRRPGERDRRAVDRHLMLEALLSARDRMLILWSGRDVQQGKEQPAAVPVEELLEIVGALTGSKRDALVREHPLQPWSAGNFASPASSFDQGMAEAAVGLRAIEAGEVRPERLGLGASGTEPLPPEEHLPETLEVGELVSALLGPHKLLLKDRLGLGVSYDPGAVEDREPLELDSLEKWKLRERVLAHVLGGPETWEDDALIDALEQRVAGEGGLPLRAGGRVLLAEEVDKARAVAENLGQVAGERAEPLELAVALDEGRRLVGRVEHVVAGEAGLLLQWHTPSSKANDRMKLTAWVHLVAAIASGHAVSGARLVGHGSTPGRSGAGGDFLRFEGDAGGARAMLQGLVDVWREARRRPLPLFKVTSCALGEVLHRAADEAPAPVELVKAAAAGWSGSDRQKGDVEDRWLATFFVGYDPLDHLDDEGPWSLIGLARTVWQPVHGGLSAGRELGGVWKREDA